MTSKVKGVINHNFPIIVSLKEENGTVRTVAQSESAHGLLEIDIWFSGKQQVIISEEQVAHHPV